MPMWKARSDASVTEPATNVASSAGSPLVSAAARDFSLASVTVRDASGLRLAPATSSSIDDLKLPAMTAPRIAIASRPATRETPLLIPLATPARRSSTELSAVAVSGATVAERPRPKRIIAGRKSVRYAESESRRMRRSRPIPPTIGPTAIGTLGPVELDTLPNHGERTNITTDTGVVARPASSGE